MAELSDIVTLTTISSDRANLWQDRLIQRYSSVANRTTEHPSPSEGDLSYLEDSNTLDVYTGAAWVPFIATNEVDGSTEVSSVALTTTTANVATVNLTIPTGWATWKCYASATFLGANNAGSAGTFSAEIRIDGTDQQSSAYSVQPGAATLPVSIQGRRTGMTTTGSRAVALRATEGPSSDISLTFISLYARAVRTS